MDSVPMIQGETGHNCPNCGGPLPPVFKHTKLIGCEFCGSAVLLDDAGLRLAGQQSVMPDAPSLLKLGQTFVHGTWTFTPVGHARFAYGAGHGGFWDEWWCLGNDGEGAWISVDEGDFALEEPVEDPPPVALDALKLGGKVDFMGEYFVVTEADEATCQAVRGSLPEVLKLGQRYRYWHLSRPLGRLVTVEADPDGGIGVSEGRWLDAYAIRAA